MLEVGGADSVYLQMRFNGCLATILDKRILVNHTDCSIPVLGVVLLQVTN